MLLVVPAAVHLRYVQDPSTAHVVFTIMESAVLKNDQVIGAASRALSTLIPEIGITAGSGASLKPSRPSILGSKRNLPGAVRGKFIDGNRWNGWIDCTIKPPTPKGGKVAAAALAGATFGGPAGAALASAVTYLWEPPIKGKVRLDLTYNAFGSTQEDNSGGSKGVAPKGGTDEVGRATADIFPL